MALCLLLTAKLPDATITMSVKDQISGGMNEMFIRHSNLKLKPWDIRPWSILMRSS